MRKSLIFLSLVLLSGIIQAQDPGMQAAQQAQMAAQQATQQALSDMQTASQNASNAMNNAQQQASSSLFSYGRSAGSSDHPRPSLAAPRFSMSSGTYSSPLTLTMNSTIGGAQIYYTTDGWTPTQYSTRYTAPIEIESTTTLQAIAVSPWGASSPVREATYTLNVKPGTQSATFPGAAPGVISNAAAAAQASGRLLLAGDTPVVLVFATAVNSRTAKVGDKIFLTLAQNLESDGVLVAKKGNPAVAIITGVNKARRLGAPGEVSFKLESLPANGMNIKLRGGAAKLGQERREKADTAGVFGLFIRGKDAQIDPGAEFTARVASDTLLPAK
jgi:hypothetical protein